MKEYTYRNAQDEYQTSNMLDIYLAHYLSTNDLALNSVKRRLLF